jgi:hypothetical protein
VVNIAVITRVAEENPLLKDPFFRRFFGFPENAPTQQERRALAAGSGVIIDAAKGLIVTNHHVIKDAETIAVTLKDGRQLKAELVVPTLLRRWQFCALPPQASRAFHSVILTASRWATSCWRSAIPLVLDKP